MTATRDTLVRLLLAARRFDNQTVRDSNEMAAWRMAVDRALEGEPGDDPADRYNTPSRVEHRRLVSSLFVRR